MESLLSITYQKTALCHSGSDIIDAIINCKAAEAEQLGIIFRFTVNFPVSADIVPVDICGVLANQIENAFDACKQMPPSYLREVKITIFKTATDKTAAACYNMRKRGTSMPNTSKTIQQLNLEDDFLFAKVMSDKEVCRKVLEKILDVSIREVSVPATQKTINTLYDGKGIRLDVYLNDNEGTVYNVEMERGKHKRAILPKRSRYYQGNIDLDIISAGEDYRKLKKSFVIFICTFDPFGDRRHLYTFENRCVENPSLTLGDETTKIFLNTKGNMHDVDPEMQEFLSYVENTTDDFAAQARSPLIKEIHKKVIEVKESKEMEVEYMTLLQRDRENIELGREEGREEGSNQMASLIKILLSENRTDELNRALEDPDFRNRLFEEYDIL